MSIPVRNNPAGLTAKQFEGLKPFEKALMLAADECDHWCTQEEPHGSNRGPRVDEFLVCAHTAVGQPWCAAMAYWCFLKAGLKLPIPYPAAVSSWFDWARRFNRLISKPKRGCLFAYTNPGHTHIGFVTGADDDGTFQTIEGNTNEDGSREGYEVARKTRRVGADGLVFISLEGLK